MKAFRSTLLAYVCCANWTLFPISPADAIDTVVPIEHRVPEPHNPETTPNAIATQHAQDEPLDAHTASASAPSSTAVDTLQPSVEKTIRVVPIGTKPYVVGLRTTRDGNSWCSASLITPTHLLAGARCAWGNLRWAAIGSHYRNGTQDGEQIRIAAILNNPDASAFTFTNDVAILVLERPSAFPPVAFATAQDPAVYDGEWLVKMGWDDTGGELDVMTYELRRADVQVMSNAECLKQTNVDDSMLCSRSAAGEAACTGHFGGPVVREAPSGDVVVAIVSWGPDCTKLGFPSVYQRVSSSLAWIESIVGRKCTTQP
ncbi:unnamed protein product [Hyaloperonospora brassicae]|uniref:Peptidase S1 domain-containing protein n=1 Tax=Hyaloperonospora brassicae TaxID=162125 RepID=A0AAV0TD02_HYABA|nr:unnamed protein product [Hyaloperonospora brassicae]